MLLGRVLNASEPLSTALLTEFETFATTLARTGVTDYSTDSSWRRLLARVQWRGEFRVAVLGMSTSAGCGAAWTADMPLEGWCDFSRSWSRHFFERVLAHIRPTAALRLHVQFKNAVGPSHFGHCTRALVPHSDLVVFDWAANAWESVGLLNRTLHAVRRAASAGGSQTQLLFVNWPHAYWKSDFTSKLESAARSHRAMSVTINTHNRERLLRIVGNQSSAVGTDLLALVSAANLTAACAPCSTDGAGEPNKNCQTRRSDCIHEHGKRVTAQLSSFYADLVHPNGAGHWLMGQGAAAVLIDRLLLASRQSREGVVAEGGDSDEVGAANTTQFREEVCLRRADQLTVRQPSAWKLVNDGTRKRVPKLGFASTVPGGVLRLDLPSALPAGLACGGVVVTLGYLTSHLWEQGLIELACEGCPCGPIGTTSGVFKYFTFPVFDTHISAKAALGLDGNLSVTAEHAFLAGQSANSSCTLVLRHRRRQHKVDGKFVEYPGPSRVRVDSIYIRRASKWDERGLKQTIRVAHTPREAGVRNYVSFRQRCVSYDR